MILFLWILFSLVLVIICINQNKEINFYKKIVKDSNIIISLDEQIVIIQDKLIKKQKEEIEEAKNIIEYLTELNKELEKT